MTDKRNIPDILKKVLRWDIDLTNKSVNIIDKNFGPLHKYKNIFSSLEISCHGIPWLFSSATLIFLNYSSIRQLCVNIFLALLMDIAIVAVIKASTRRRRPVKNTNDMFATYAMDKFSFPSGHATRAVMLATLLTSKYNLMFPLPLLLLLWAASVCVSRVLMRRHHILDVAGGLAIGWAEALFMSHVIWLSDQSTALLVGALFRDMQGAEFGV